MRVAQADDALSELKKMLRIKMGLWNYKHTQVGPSQRVSTRTLSMINGYRDKIDRCADRYRAARSALLILSPNGDWIQRLRILNPDDVRSPVRDEDDETEGHRQPSWIWLTQRDEGSISVCVDEGEVNESKSIL
jgi:hypothetical protein